jgi:hypothetical protein
MNDLTSVAFLTAVAAGIVSAITAFIAAWQLRRGAKEHRDALSDTNAKLMRMSLARTADVKIEVGGKEVDLTDALTGEELASLIEKALSEERKSGPE